MARTRLSHLPTVLGVFLGGLLGGGIRLGIDAIFSPLASGFPVDIVTINLVGAFSLGLMTGWASKRGYRAWMPAVGTGALGTFTTFSALTGLPWVASTSVVLVIALATAVIVGAIGAASLGWRVGERWSVKQSGELK